MQYLQSVSFLEDNSYDDIDELFSRLEPIEPPASLISDILKEVRQTQASPLFTQPVRLHSVQSWNLEHQKSNAC